LAEHDVGRPLLGVMRHDLRDASTSIPAISPAAKPWLAISLRSNSIGACAVTWQA
jgi:hypothetical protein